MILEKAILSNINVLQEICLSAYSQNFAHHWEAGGLELYLESQFSIKRLTADIIDPNIDYYFIKEADKPIGFTKIKLNAIWDDTPKKTVVELEKIYLLPETKGNGIGKKALWEIIEIVKSLDKKTLFLCVIDTNTVAIAFYKKLGFQFHSKTRLDAPFFKEELKGMHRMVMNL